MMRENLEYLTEYDWNADRKSPRQRRCGFIALVLLGLAACGALLLVKSL